MEKRHISRVMLWETIYTAILSLLFGIACGILFSKLVFLGLLKILKMEVVIGGQIYQMKLDAKGLLEVSAKLLEGIGIPLKRAMNDSGYGWRILTRSL